MKTLGDAAARAARHRAWHWCRRHNGFSDRPTWRAVAGKLGMPVHQVVAFVHRLEELANAAEPRGSIVGFKAYEFGEALGMSADDAARIFAALEEPEVAWIAYEHVADFFERNRDWEDDTAAERQRRKRARDSILKKLVALTRVGKIAAARRTEIESRLVLMELDELGAVQVELRRAELSTGEDRHGRHSVTPVTAEKGVSAPSVRHTVTPRDSVTVTPDKSREFQAPPVDNSGEAARGETKGPSEVGMPGPGSDPQADAALWIDNDGKRLVVERMGCLLTQADLFTQRWLHQALSGDAVALMNILMVEQMRATTGAKFHVAVTSAIDQHARVASGRAELQQQLPLHRIEGLPAKKSA